MIKSYLHSKLFFYAIGITNIILFHWAIIRLFFFLWGYQGHTMPTALTWREGLNNLILLIFFTVPHSLLLQTNVRTAILKALPQGLYSTLYSIHASIGILLLDRFWVSTSSIIQFSERESSIIFVLYAFSWIFMAWSIWATGPFKQSGINDWWNSLQGKNIKNELNKNGPYSFCRHPIYSAFLGMIWFTPHLGLERILLIVVWTFYILWGAWRKDQRLIRNRSYAIYASKTPPFPFMPKKIEMFFNLNKGIK